MAGKGRVRRDLQDRQGNRCAYCNVLMDGATGSYDTDEPTIDHIQPLALGGADDVMNRVAACRRCNETKGCRTSDEMRDAAWALDDQAARLFLLADRMDQMLRLRVGQNERRAG